MIIIPFSTLVISLPVVLGVSFFFFDAEAEFKYPDWLTSGKVKRKILLKGRRIVAVEYSRKYGRDVQYSVMWHLARLLTKLSRTLLTRGCTSEKGEN